MYVGNGLFSLQISAVECGDSQLTLTRITTAGAGCDLAVSQQ